MGEDSDEVSSKTDPHRDLAGALHDVSNALTVMLGWVSEARAKGAPREAVDYALRIIEQRARVARNLSRRAIGADITADELDLLEPLVLDAVEALAVEASRSGVTFHREGDLRGVQAPSAGDVAQIVTNLLMNAIAHTPHGGVVSVSASATDTRVTIDVSDTGPGIVPSRRLTVFEGDTRRRGGAGIGLRHARALARAAGGELTLLDPAAPSARGAAHFRLEWPRTEALPPPPVSVPRLRMFDRTRILVLEDDEHVTQLLEAALTVRGAQVTVARSMRDLPSALLAGPHDAVLLDLSPIAADVSGAFAALRASSPNATFVVISGSAVALPDALAEASVRFVRKPFEVGEIVNALAGRLIR